MPQFLGEFHEFNETIVKPIKKAFIESESLSLSLKVFQNSNETQLEKNVQISTEGLSILRSLHKQVIFIIFIFLYFFLTIIIYYYRYFLLY